MQKSTLPEGIGNLKTWYQDKKTLHFEHPVQRASGQWSNLQKSLLIHSILSGYPIPAVYLLKEKRGKDIHYECLDAKQRLLSIFEFIDGDYELHSTTPPIEIDGVVYPLANLDFLALSDKCQDRIMGCRLDVYCLEDCTYEEVEEIFRRLNNSTPLSAIQKTRTVMGFELTNLLRKFCSHDFIAHRISLTQAQARREADLEVLLQSMLLLDALHEGYDYKAISTAEVTKYCASIRGKYSKEKQQRLQKILDYLAEAFINQHKFLKKSNVPMVIVLADYAIDKKVSPKEFKIFIDDFNSSENKAYEENTGSGNIKRTKTEGRLKALGDAFAEHFNYDGVSLIPEREEPTTEQSKESASEKEVVEKLVSIVSEPKKPQEPQKKEIDVKEPMKAEVGATAKEKADKPTEVIKPKDVKTTENKSVDIKPTETKTVEPKSVDKPVTAPKAAETKVVGQVGKKDGKN